MNTEQEFNEKSEKLGENIKDRGARVYSQIEETVSEAYEKGAPVIDQAKTYVQNNPGKTLLFAFGIGVVFGVSLCSRQSRSSRSPNAVLDAVYDIASSLIR